MENIEEAIRNIDVFCKVLVDKLVHEEENSNITVEPMEKLLYKKCITDAQRELSPEPKHLIPLPHLEEPLIDVLNDDEYVKILMQCRCREQEVTVHPSADGIKICKKECHTNVDGAKICTDRCQKLDLPSGNLQIEDMTIKCCNNAVFEVDIPKK